MNASSRQVLRSVVKYRRIGDHRSRLSQAQHRLFTSDDEDDKHSKKPQRNKALAEVIRQGLPLLNQTALDIQNAKESSRPLFVDPTDRGPSERQLAEGHRLYTTANECLEELSRKDPRLLIGGEPIWILNVDVEASLRKANVYWTLPLGLLVILSERQQTELMLKAEEALQPALTRLQQQIHARLRGYYAPKVHFQAANEGMVQQAVAEMVDEF